ncbi:hypothetical protein [Candidatus Spongiihabitans sp.]|uniref:hypothetical protein n=1 Tax=Candidatus Spongiihabitans sp. TaxID=3101308 RepID=UPI003C7CAF65
MVNNCHAKPDTKTCSGVARLLILNVPLASQLAFVLSIHHCPIICHCPAHIIIIGRAIQLLNRSA